MQALFEHFRKRKLIWTIVLVILIVGIIAIPTIIVTVNKGKREKTSTIQLTTVEVITKEIATTIEDTAQITTEKAVHITPATTTVKAGLTTTTTNPAQITTATTEKPIHITASTEKAGYTATTTNSVQTTTATEKSTEITTEKTPQMTTTTAERIVTNKLLTTTTNEELHIISSVIINEETKWKQSATIVAGGHGQGSGLNQLDRPRGIYVDEDSESIYIADSMNHRIVRWKFDADKGEVVAGGTESVDEIDQLKLPTDVILDKEKTSLIICDQRNKRVIRWSLQNSQDKEILISDIFCWGLVMDNDGNLYISDYINHVVRRWQQGDTIVVGDYGQGDQFNQFDQPKYIFVDGNHSIYVADYANNRVMKWMKDATEGILVAPGEDSRGNFNSLRQPIGVIVDHVGNIYVSSESSPQITRWSPGAIEGVPVVGEKQLGSELTQLNYPYDLSFDRYGNLYVVDSYNHRIQKFIIDRG
ncbi:unnamed protein product [Adineta steineri]|uniref:NHL repeat containing protein n=1 Tax=Adineta steineri TaxID=433720 RepID=A0A815GKT0_9BILA|nr:unnamed protein product [Adineta steineri]CAF1339544.1 unnamed protein product [Adineta steineri]CAF1348394.1 unnamed protein product [Adineta steineri]